MKLFKKPNPPAKGRVGPHTRKVLSERKIKVKKKVQDNVNRFTTEHKDCILWLETNYDLLQYNMVIAPHVIKKYDIDNRDLLDVLLYIFPIQFFTRNDYHQLPIRNISKNNFKHMLKKGYIEVHVPSKINAIYTTSNKTKEIVKDYYLLLSGRRKIKAQKTFKTEHERKQDSLIQQLKEQAKSNPERYKNFMIKK